MYRFERNSVDVARPWAPSQRATSWRNGTARDAGGGAKGRKREGGAESCIMDWRARESNGIVEMSAGFFSGGLGGRV